MNLYTLLKNNEKIVYGCAVGGKLFFFFSGFNTAEEAKQATIAAHVTNKLKNIKPNPQGIKPPTSLIKTEVEMALDGEWSEIE